MDSSKKIILFSLAALLFSNAVPVRATAASAAAKIATNAISYGTIGKTIAANPGSVAFYTGLTAALVHFWMREPDNAKSRCDWARLSSSFTGSLGEKNNILTVTILGYDLERKEKKELGAIVVGIRNNKGTIIPLTKIDIVKVERADLQKSCEKLRLEEAEKPAYATMNPAAQAEYWIKPELNCKVKIFAITDAPKNAHLAYQVVDPQFVDMSKKEVASVQDLATLKAKQVVTAKAIANELVNDVNDGLIGHRYKEGSPRVNLETRKIESGPAVAPKGIFGCVHGYWKPFVFALGTVAMIHIAQQALVDPAELAKNAEKLAEHWRSLFVILGATSLLPKTNFLPDAPLA
jgi:hypothetical protein